MRRWIILGLVIMLAFVVAANLTGPSAWASDSHAPYLTVPTEHCRPTRQWDPPPPKESTDIRSRRSTNAPATIQPTNTVVVTTPTRTATPQVTSTATALAETVEPTLTPTATNDQATATATSEATPAAAVLVAPTLDGSANVEPVVSAASVAEQVVGSTPADNSSNLWLLIVAAVLILFGGVLLFGRRRTQDSAK
jgi:cobalamin biosynthesis Mg chelatase CobN